MRAANHDYEWSSCTPKNSVPSQPYSCRRTSGGSLLDARLLSLKPPIETRPADLRQRSSLADLLSLRRCSITDAAGAEGPVGDFPAHLPTGVGVELEVNAAVNTTDRHLFSKMRQTGELKRLAGQAHRPVHSITRTAAFLLLGPHEIRIHVLGDFPAHLPTGVGVELEVDAAVNTTDRHLFSKMRQTGELKRLAGQAHCAVPGH